MVEKEWSDMKKVVGRWCKGDVGMKMVMVQ